MIKSLIMFIGVLALAMIQQLIYWFYYALSLGRGKKLPLLEMMVKINWFMVKTWGFRKTSDSAAADMNTVDKMIGDLVVKSQETEK